MHLASQSAPMPTLLHAWFLRMGEPRGTRGVTIQARLGGILGESRGNRSPKTHKKARLFRSGLFCKCLIYRVFLVGADGFEPPTYAL